MIARDAPDAKPFITANLISFFRSVDSSLFFLFIVSCSPLCPTERNSSTQLFYNLYPHHTIVSIRKNSYQQNMLYLSFLLIFGYYIVNVNHRYVGV
jgi:hypothetical protein